MTPAQLPWQPWGLEKVVSLHRPGPAGVGILTGSQNCTRDPAASAGLSLPLSMSRCGLNGSTCLPLWAMEKGSDVFLLSLKRLWEGAVSAVQI